MNDSTPEIPADLPDADPSATAAAPKKAAVKRAPRKKKVEPAQAVEVQDVVDVAEPPALAGELPHGLSQQDVPVAPVVANEPAIPEAEAGASDATSEPRHGERQNRGDGRARQPRLDGAGRDKRKAGAPAVQGYQFEDVVSGRFDEDDASAEMVPEP